MTFYGGHANPPGYTHALGGHKPDMSDEGRSIRLTIPARPEYITLGRLALTAIPACDRSRTRRCTTSSSR